MVANSPSLYGPLLQTNGVLLTRGAVWSVRCFAGRGCVVGVWDRGLAGVGFPTKVPGLGAVHRPYPERASCWLACQMSSCRLSACAGDAPRAWRPTGRADVGGTAALSKRLLTSGSVQPRHHMRATGRTLGSAAAPI